MELTINDLSKEYGRKKAVNHFSAKLTNGVYGLLGANGAGKTTLMRIICDVQTETKGAIFFNGKNIHDLGEKYRNILGYLPQNFGYYPNFTAYKFLMYISAIKGLPPKKAHNRTMELLQVVDLLTQKNEKIKTFSGGMKQRLGIAQALLNRPKLLICDEPTSALDPAGRKEILDILLAAKEQTTILFSTHILSDVERICTEVAFLNNGKITMQGTIAELRNKQSCGGFIIEVEKKEVANMLAEAFNELQHAEENALIFQGDDNRFFDMMQYISENRIPIQKIERLEPTLETLFLEVTK